jgi:excisionase family DNA binding protein
VNGRLLTTREVADELGVTPDTVLTWTRERGLPAIRLTSRAIRFRPAEVEAWLAERETANGAAEERVTEPHAPSATRKLMGYPLGVTELGADGGAQPKEN